MKWLSVKKFKPPADMTVFVLIRMGNIRVAEYNYENEGWVYKSEIALVFTHFCIPDPIEIEEG